jgi:GYF domain 2
MDDIYLHVDGKQAGPYPLEKVRWMLNDGKVSGDTLAWRQGMTQWSTVSSLLAATPASAARPVFVQPQGSSMNGCLIAAIIAGGLAVVLVITSVIFGLMLRPKLAELERISQQRVSNTSRDVTDVQHSAMTVQTGYLADVLNRYASDHGGAYPDGQTSTEVFQKLLDEKYIFDPTVFYFPMKGKTKPTGTKLTADNVCFDLTSGITAKSSKSLPIVFTTGYNITYAAGTGADSDTTGHDDLKGIAVTYLNGSSSFQAAAATGAVPNFVDSGFDPAGATYRQLKP